MFAALALMAAAVAGIALAANKANAPPPSAVPAIPDMSEGFIYSFNSPGVLEEADSPAESSSPYWWLSSGGELLIANGVGSTMIGDAPAGNEWRQEYASSNPQDTDGGLHPQNLFRLVTHGTWEDASEELTFRILADHFSPSWNRNTSNGVLLMSRYADSQTLYYAGIRVDGTAVIKKKYRGTYYTMAQEKAFPGTYEGWQQDTDLLPHDRWLALRSDAVTNGDGSVTITLFFAEPGATSTPAWRVLARATDHGQYDGTPPLTGGRGGIRTDFMDVRFDSFSVRPLATSTPSA